MILERWVNRQAIRMLLDWLTQRFLENGWRLKPLHELIMNSATYQQTTRREPSTQESTIDPTNRLLWRFPPKRLDAEQVRDAMLAVSGELKQRDGGPSVSGASPYRSVYVKKLRNSPDEMLNGFDAPLGFESAPDQGFDHHAGAVATADQRQMEPRSLAGVRKTAAGWERSTAGLTTSKRPIDWSLDVTPAMKKSATR